MKVAFLRETRKNRRISGAKMLVEFSVSNYKSFRGVQTLSLNASAASRNDRMYSFETNHNMSTHLLRTASILGPNGSGKSTFLKALSFLDQFVLHSAKDSQKGELIDVVPFKFAKEAMEEKSTFEIVFIQGSNLYQYGLAVDSARVYEEWLYRTPEGKSQKPTRIFERYYNSDESSYQFYINPSIRGPKEVWRESTRENASFLSTAVLLSAEPFMEPYNWFQKSLMTAADGNRFSPYMNFDYTEDPKLKNFALGLLQSADLGIVDMKFEDAFRGEEYRTVSIPGPDGTQRSVRIKNPKMLNVELGHLVGEEIIYLDLEDESDGTKVLLGLAYAWYDILQSGKILFIDELSNSLHPLVLTMLVDMFNSATVNNKNAQLVFTSHETAIMEGGNMARDQINLIQRGRDQSSQIIPLSDFSPRVDENLRRGYLQGRYQGIPLIAR